MRAFISVDIGALPSLVDIIQKLKDTGAGLKIVKPENLHLTLKFLGETREELVDEIMGVMKKSVEDIKPFKIELIGMGAFPSLKYIRVIWIGLEEMENLFTIADRLNQDLTHLNFRRERRGFSPHLTIGRVKTARNKEKLQQFLEKNGKKNFGKVLVDRIRLKKSVLSREGPTYFTVKEVEI